MLFRSPVNKVYTKRLAKRERKSTKARGQTSKQTNGIFNTNAHMTRALVPQLPREMEFSSKYSTYDIRLANTTPSTFVFGLIDFYNQLPAYAASFYQIYKYARINAIHVQVELVSTGTEPLLIAMDVLPYSQATSTFVDPHFIASRPRAVSKMVGTSTGMSRIMLNKTYKTAESLGQLNYSDSAWQSYSEALSVLPDPDHPFVCISVDSVLASATWSADAVYHVTYHMQFFEQQDPSLTTTPEEYQSRRLDMVRARAQESSRGRSADDSFRSQAPKRK